MKLEARRRKVDVLILPTDEAIETLANKAKRTNVILVPSQNLEPDILMTQPAKDGNCRDIAYRYRATEVRRIFIQ